eukprot:4295196-Alexandrium_andersonii.AAC.1
MGSDRFGRPTAGMSGATSMPSGGFLACSELWEAIVIDGDCWASTRNWCKKQWEAVGSSG